MYEAVILICRFLFVFYIVFFLWQAVRVTFWESRLFFDGIGAAFSNQRLSVIFFHITAMLIISYDKNRLMFDVKTLTAAFIGLILIICSNIVLSAVYAGASKLMFNCVFFTVDIGFVMLLRLNRELAQKQLVWYAVGIGVLCAVPFLFKIMPRLDKLKYLYLALGAALLAATLLLGDEQGGAKNWIKIGQIGFQPSEIVKLLFVFYIASALCKPPELKNIIETGAAAAVFILCLVLQRDLGSALIFFMCFLTMSYIATGSIFLFASVFVGGACASMLAYRLFSHVRVRVETWLNPWADIDDGGYQITQSLFAIGTWGIFGSGYTKGYAGSIPVVERDFIFAAICEEFGIVFAVCFICVLICIFLCGLKAALRNHNRFLSLVASGLTGLLCFQSFIIIGGVTKLIPLTGVTLPFVGYGGTSVVISFAAVGIIQWIYSMNTKRDMTERLREAE